MAAELDLQAAANPDPVDVRHLAGGNGGAQGARSFSGDLGPESSVAVSGDGFDGLPTDGAGVTELQLHAACLGGTAAAGDGDAASGLDLAGSDGDGQGHIGALGHGTDATGGLGRGGGEE